MSEPSPNGRHPPSSWTRLRVDRASSGYCRVTFHPPPVGPGAATTVVELTELIGLMEADPDLNVVVFDSADPRSYLTRDDDAASDQGRAAWLGVLDRMSRAPMVSIASIRGHVRAAGTEFVLACDLRFASPESRFETDLGAVLRGAATARLARLVGPGRALEILLLPCLEATRAERYGYVNRLFPGDRLDDEVEDIAIRLARFDREALGRVKASVGRQA